MDGPLKAVDRKLLEAIAKWGFPFVGLLATLVSQVLTPRILQLELSSGEYISYVAVSSVIGYLALADGGLLVSILRELSVQHSAGDRPAFAGEIKRAKTVFAAISVVGCILVSIALLSALAASERAWPGATSNAFRLSAACMLAVSALLMGVGSYHSVLQFSTGKLLAGQVVGVVGVVLPLVGLLVPLALTRNLAVGLLASAGTTSAVVLWRALDARRIAHEETSDTTPAKPRTPLSSLLASGVALKAADVLPSSAFPHLLSVEAPDAVPSGIPARTYANACRLVPQQFLYLLQVHITRRMAGSDSERSAGSEEYGISANAMCCIHLVSLGLLALLASAIFRIWLPMRAHNIGDYLPGLFVEQALVSASLPSSILFIAKGRLGLLGIVRLIGIAIGLPVFLLLLPRLPVQAFGIGLAVSAIPLFVLGLTVEMTITRRSLGRYGLAAVSAVACMFYAGHPFVVGLVVLSCSALLIPTSMRGLWKVFQQVRRNEPATDGV